MYRLNYYDGSVLTCSEYVEYEKDYYCDDYRIVPKDEVESIEEYDDEEE